MLTKYSEKYPIALIFYLEAVIQSEKEVSQISQIPKQIKIGNFVLMGGVGGVRVERLLNRENKN